MKKTIVLMVMSLLVVSAGVMAAELGFNVGATYNTFDGTGYVDGDKDFEEDLDNGIGFFVEGLYPLDDKFRIGGGFDYAIASYDSDGEYKLSGPYAKLAYRINESLDVNAAVAYYKVKDEYEDESEDFAEGFGYLLGICYTHPITDELTFIFGGDFRIAKLDVDKDYAEVDDAEYDLSGFRANAALSFNF